MGEIVRVYGITDYEQRLMFDAGADTTVGRAVIYTLCHATMLWCGHTNTMVRLWLAMVVGRLFVLIMVVLLAFLFSP